MEKRPVKRLNIVFSQELYDELQEVADRQNATISSLIRQSVKLLLMATRVEETPGAALLIKEGDSITEIRPII